MRKSNDTISAANKNSVGRRPGNITELSKAYPETYGLGANSYAVRIVHGFSHRAKRRGIPYELTQFETIRLVQEPCFYCKATYTLPLHNGIDRVDNSLGYTKENSVSCCKWCNYAKNIMTIEEFKSHIIKMYENFAKPNT